MEYKEILKGLKKASYGFIANNYHNLSKEQLKDILLEYIYVTDSESEKEARENLAERWDFWEEV